MSIYSNVESGTKMYRTRFHKSISFSKKFDCRYGEMIPVLAKFVMPGDVWRIGGQALVRFQPMQTPSLTPSYMKVRYFFVPLRLIEPNTELIITGSTDGHLYSGTLPEFKNMFADADTNQNPNAYKIPKWSFWDYLGCQVADYTSFATDSCLPAQYWMKGYARIKFDYYDDENIGGIHTVYTDFETYWTAARKNGGSFDVFKVSLPKDYFTSSLPWQLKGTAPVLNVTGSSTIQWTPNFSGIMFDKPDNPFYTKQTVEAIHMAPDTYATIGTQDDSLNADLNQHFANILNTQQTASATVTGLGFNADELRTMIAQTRIFERLARTGSRYTEYLRANFGTAPADDTLQRAQYLGGWKLPIVTTE